MIRLITMLYLMLYVATVTGQTCARAEVQPGIKPISPSEIRQAFSVVVLPDTQYYTLWWPEIFAAQTDWIVDQRHNLNIVAVAHLGDIVQNAEVPDEWATADACLSTLDLFPELPRGLVVGNHDQYPRGSPYGTAGYNETFPASRYESQTWYGGHADGDNDNHYILFDGCGYEFVAVFLECDFQVVCPQNITWAESVLQQYPDRQAMIFTHNLLGATGYWNCPQASTLWAAVRDEPNLILMAGGHNCCEIYRGMVADDGHVVHCFTADFQCLPHGGDGWLRILRFVPSQHVIHVETYSPWLDDYQTDGDSQFNLPLY